MTDDASRRGIHIDDEKLAERLGCPVVRAGAKPDGRQLAAALEQASAPRTLPAGDADALERWADAMYDEVASAATGGREARESLTDRLDRAFTPPGRGRRDLRRRDDGALLRHLPARDVPDGLDRHALRLARGRGRGRAAPGADRGALGRRRDRGRRGDGHLPPADRAALLPDHAAGAIRVSGACGLRDRPAPAPVRAAGARLRAAALGPRVRAAGHHVGAGRSRTVAIGSRRSWCFRS